jgi:hypothetical protein
MGLYHELLRARKWLATRGVHVGEQWAHKRPQPMRQALL